MNYRILFVLTPAFNPQEGGVQHTTFKLATKFKDLGATVGVFSFNNEGHISSSDIVIFYPDQQGGCYNARNILFMQRMLVDFEPNIVINQMPFDKPIRVALLQLRLTIDFYLIACLRNSLFVFKNNRRSHTMKMVPSFVFKFIDNSMGLTIFEWFFNLRYKNILNSILAIHDKFVLLTHPNVQELKYFLPQVPMDKIDVIPNSIPFITPKLPVKEKIILFVGRIAIEQNESRPIG